jgi:hypothetical protein
VKTFEKVNLHLNVTSASGSPLTVSQACNSGDGQTLLPDKPIEWCWSFTPQAEGRHFLDLSLRSWRTGSDGDQDTSWNQRLVLDVDRTWWETLWDEIKANLFKVLAGAMTLLIGFVTWFWKNHMVTADKPKTPWRSWHSR